MTNLVHMMRILSKEELNDAKMPKVDCSYGVRLAFLSVAEGIYSQLSLHIKTMTSTKIFTIIDTVKLEDLRL